MNRDVLLIPLEEVTKHFETNERQDIKIIAPSILTPQLYEMLIQKGKPLKPEEKLNGDRWEMAYKTKPNKLCESPDFPFDMATDIKGLFTIAFANHKAEQQEHYHKHHAEIYFSVYKISGYYRKLGQNAEHQFELSCGGLVLFQPNVIHYVELSGLTLILETPALEEDRFVEEKPHLGQS